VSTWVADPLAEKYPESCAAWFSRPPEYLSNL